MALDAMEVNSGQSLGRLDFSFVTGRFGGVPFRWPSRSPLRLSLRRRVVNRDYKALLQFRTGCEASPFPLLIIWVSVLFALIISGEEAVGNSAL